MHTRHKIDNDSGSFMFPFMITLDQMDEVINNICNNKHFKIRINYDNYFDKLYLVYDENGITKQAFNNGIRNDNGSHKYTYNDIVKLFNMMKELKETGVDYLSEE